MQPLLAAAIACLVPPVWIALGGGADVDVAGQRVELYALAGPSLALAAAVLLAGLPHTTGAQRVARLVALVAVGVTAGVVWTGGFETETIHVIKSKRPGQIAALLAGVALFIARGGFSPRRAFGSVAAGLALGFVVLLAVRAADTSDLERRLEANRAHANSLDVIFLLVDTLRADALGAYGATPSPSPFLDDLAARSVVFERALSQAQWTAPSVSSLLSSLYPSSFLWDDTMISDERLIVLPEGMPWLPAVLDDAGYHTAAFVKNPLMQGGTRFGRGFDVHEWVRGHTAEEDSARELVDAVLRWGDALARRRAAGDDSAFFAYVHFMDPHARYQPPAAFMPSEPYEGPVDGGVRALKRLAELEEGPAPEDLARAVALYRAEVAYLDHEIARLHTELSARGLWGDDTLVVVVSDHGEQFYEHGSFFHGRVHWENLHVPFILSGPGLTARRVAAPVAMLDVAPTLLELLGIASPDAMEGKSLVPQLRGAPMPRRFVVTESIGKLRAVRTTGPDGSLMTTRRRAWFEDTEGQLHSLDSVSPEAERTVMELREIHARHEERVLPGVIDSAVAEGQHLDPDADTRDRLRALGYID